MDKKKAILYIIIGILLLPILILLSPVLLIIHYKNKRAEKKKRQQAREKWEAAHQPTQFKESYTEFYTKSYTESPQQPEEEFIRRIGEFTCLQFYSRNDRTGADHKQELIATEHPEKKAKILEFLKEHPIEELLHGQRHANAHDVNRWEFRFIFEDTRLNRTISGYGHTELTAPYLSEMCRYIPRILSEEEKFRQMVERARLERELEKLRNSPTPTKN